MQEATLRGGFLFGEVLEGGAAGCESVGQVGSQLAIGCDDNYCLSIVRAQGPLKINTLSDLCSWISLL